jgi:hypothetical protein
MSCDGTNHPETRFSLIEADYSCYFVCGGSAVVADYRL